MKPEQDYLLGEVTLPRAGYLARLHTPEIVGEVANPVLEAIRRLWWRALYRLCGWFMSSRLWFLTAYTDKPLTSAHLRRETND